MTSTNNQIHLALAFDQNFVTPFYVLLTSIFHNNKNSSLFFHVIGTGIRKPEKDRIRNYVTTNQGIIFFYEIDIKAVENLSMPDNVHFSSATYYRLFFPRLVPPELTKLLYLDTDTIVINDLLDLYNLDILSNPVGAAKDVADVGIRSDLGIYSKDEYFNAGVLLINLEEWRQQNISEKALKFIAEFPEKVKWADQDALNAVLNNKWYKLDQKFNLTYDDIPINLTKKKLKFFLKETVIIHFTTEQKPWLMLCRNRFRFLYHFYLKKSPQYTQKKYIDSTLNYKVLFSYFKIRIKEFLIDYADYSPKF